MRVTTHSRSAHPRPKPSGVSAERSRIMRAVKSRDTGPEKTVRRIVAALGYRYRLNRADLPGKPDLTIAARRCALFVHGCFWHGHRCRRGARMPRTNSEYWSLKIARNRARDITARRRLKKLGWRVMVVWECQLRSEAKSVGLISRFLEGVVLSDD